jgi:hypothetical protein
MGFMADMDRGKSSACAKTTGLFSAGKALKFFCLFVLVYGLLMAAWPATGVVYSKIYWVTGKVLFDYFRHFGIVEFAQSDDKGEIYITAYNRYRMDRKGNMSGGKSIHKIRYGDYMYMAFLSALVIATPVSLRRRVWALVCGLLLMQVLAITKLAIVILGLFGSEEVSILVLSPFWARIVVTSYQIVVNNLTTSFIIAFFIWILVVFRRADWERIVAMEGTGGQK